MEDAPPAVTAARIAADSIDQIGRVPLKCIIMVHRHDAAKQVTQNSDPRGMPRVTFSLTSCPSRRTADGGVAGA